MILKNHLMFEIDLWLHCYFSLSRRRLMTYFLSYWIMNIFLRNKEWSPTNLHCDWYVLVEFILVAWNLYDKSLERWCCLWFFNHLLIFLLHVVRFSERINEKQINRIWKIIRLINTIWTFIIIILLNNFEKNKR